MKILQVINEGIIRVPEDTINQAMVRVLSHLFATILKYLDQKDEPDLIDIYEKLLKKYQAKYGKMSLDLDKTIYMRMNDLNKSYLSRNPKARGRTYGILLNVTMPDREYGVDGDYSERTTGKSTLNIYLPPLKNIHKIADAPELFGGLVDRLVGLVTHELMHAVQDLALDQLDQGEISSYYKDNKELDDEKYYNSNVEFGPQIMSAAKEFLANIKDLKAMNVDMSAENVRANLNRFVNPTAPEPSGVQGMRSKFFDVLYDKDKDKWKKAVKYLYGLIQNELKQLT